MTRGRRWVVMAVVGAAVALALSGPAGAEVKALVSVDQLPVLGRTTPFVINVIRFPGSDELARFQFTTPPQFTLNPFPAQGVPMGTEIAGLQLSGPTGPTTFVPGTLYGDTPTRWTLQSSMCTGVPSHWAAISSGFTVNGKPVQIPTFVDPVPGGGFRFDTCLPPQTPETGCPPIGSFGVRMNSSLVSPGSSGLYAFAALLSGYDPAGVLNPADDTRFFALDPVPQRLTLNFGFDRPKTHVNLSGRLFEAGQHPAGVTVDLFAGTPKTGAIDIVAKTTTKKGGFYKFTRPHKKVVQVFEAYVPSRERECLIKGDPPCSGRSISPEFSREIKVKRR